MMKLSIQQQELTNNIKKLAKGLKSFSLSDINLMLPNNDKDIDFCIKYLISKNIIKETANDSYIYIEQKVSNDISISDYYIKKQKNKFKEINFGNINCKIKDFTEEINISFESLDEYKNLDKKQKQRLRKILTILKLAGKLRGNELKKLLKELGKENKESSISYPHFIKLKRKFIRYGINGILFHYGNNKGKTIIPQKMYDDFKKIYFSKNISIKDTLELLRQNNYKEKIPCAVTFGRMLNREYTKEELYNLRLMKTQQK